MRITKTIIWLWLLFFLPFFVFKLYNRYKTNEEYEKSYSNVVSWYIGSKFPVDNLLDSSGAVAKIDVSKSEKTVVDFWSRDCPPCLKDMHHYSKLIQRRDKEISVYTVNINRYDIWKPLLHSSTKPFSILSRPVSNWRHLVLKSNEDPKLNNPVPNDNASLLQNTFQTGNLPMYFVLDKNGIIKATPFSLSKYIELEILKRNPFWYFLTTPTTWTADYFFIPSAFVEYSGYFWITIILILSVVNRLTSACQNSGWKNSCETTNNL